MNQLLEEAHSSSWLDAIDVILNTMSNRISDLRERKIEKAKADVVPKVHDVLQERWRKLASCRVLEIEIGSSRFKVTRIFVKVLLKELFML